MLFRFIAQIGYTILIVIETLLSLRFILKFINIGDSAQIIKWLYTFTDKILFPFMGIVPDSSKFLGFTIEWTTLLVILVITICGYALNEIIKAFQA